MLLLAPPSRRAHDVAISLRAPAGDAQAAAVVVDVALGSSCPADKAERVRSAILHSGRYDCRVSFAVVMDCVIAKMRHFLAEVGAEILVIGEDGGVVPDDVRLAGHDSGGALRWNHRIIQPGRRIGRR